MLIYYVIGCLINGFEIGAPIFMILVIAPMMLVGGGNEEVGWRMILQPELEKKFGFNLATILTGITWWLWHFPIFFIKSNKYIPKKSQESYRSWMVHWWKRSLVT